MLHFALGARVSAVELATSNERVTLYGTVRTKKDKVNAGEVVLSVPGVVGVRNLLQVVTPPNTVRTKRSDDAIKADVRRTLSADHSLDDSRITVTSVSNGLVLLGGSAASIDDDIRALRATADRPGVRQVFSAIEACGRRLKRRFPVTTVGFHPMVPHAATA